VSYLLAISVLVNVGCILAIRAQIMHAMQLQEDLDLERERVQALIVRAGIKSSYEAFGWTAEYLDDATRDRLGEMQ
jgi:hypothetical protein